MIELCCFDSVSTSAEALPAYMIIIIEDHQQYSQHIEPPAALEFYLQGGNNTMTFKSYQTQMLVVSGSSYIFSQNLQMTNEQQHVTAFPPKTAENTGTYYALCMITYLRVLQHFHTGVGLPQHSIAPTGGITSSCLQSPKDVWHAANICRGHCSPDGTGGAGDCREAALGAVPVGSLNMEGTDYASELILIPHLQHAWLQTHAPHFAV
jgi:hypothetical protein